VLQQTVEAREETPDPAAPKIRPLEFFDRLDERFGHEAPPNSRNIRGRQDRVALLCVCSYC
jgi:hypothetical protein